MKNKKDNFYHQPQIAVSDERFQTRIKLEENVKAIFPIDQKFCKAKRDNINPDYYGVGGIETFEFLKAKLSPSQLAGFCKGNVIKYLARADNKGKVEDLKKARWYLDKLIEELDDQATS